jgi:hypothetical protein
VVVIVPSLSVAVPVKLTVSPAVTLVSLLLTTVMGALFY